MPVPGEGAGPAADPAAPTRWLLHRALRGPDGWGCWKCATADGPEGCCAEGRALRAAARAALGLEDSLEPDAD